MINKHYVQLLKKIDYLSAVSVRLTKLLGKSKYPVHPKHFMTQTPWFTEYLTKSDIILDLGSGNGQNAIKAAKIVKKVVGLEFDQRLINIAKKTVKTKKVKNIEFRKANLENKLHLPTNYFHKVIFLDVLEHLHQRDQILSEVKRVLKPNGLLFVGVPNNGSSWKKLQRSVGVCSFADPDHKIEFAEKSIKLLLNKHKFKVTKFMYGKFDTPLRGLFDIIGAISLPFYKKLTNWRQEKSNKNHEEASGFEIVCEHLK